MTEIASKVTNIDPKRLFDDERVATERRTYTHENADHCEADAAGRAIVGVTDGDGQILLLVNPEESHAILPNETVAPGGNWAAVGRQVVEGYVDIDVALDSVERVRRVEHVVEGEAASTTHHVVFGASVASAETTLDSLCADNDWTVGWYDELPVKVNDDEAGVLDDIRLFLD